MRIYTKTGDDGFTCSANGQRLRKNDPCCEAIGSLDELSAQLGMCRQAARQGPPEIPDALDRSQEALYAIGSLLAAAGPETSFPDASVAEMERRIDAISASLPELTSFVRPGGC